MKKIKISELPLFSSLKGLFTIGTDDQNRSVKVSLEFIETETKAAVSKAETSAANADRAAANAITVKVDIQEMLDRLIPTGLTVTAPLRLTLGNPKASVIAKLTPETALKNVIFISDDKAVEVDVLTGRLTTLVCGKSKVRIIPTTNVSLTKTLLIEVGEATLRLQTKSALRLTSGGALRMN